MIILQVNHLSKSFQGTPIFTDLNFTIQDHEKVALVGQNGVGKSTLLKILSGELSYDSGDIHLKKGCSLGYLAQNTVLESEKTIWEAMQEPFIHIKKMHEELNTLTELLSQNHAPDKLQELLKRYDQLQHQFQEADGYHYEHKIKTILHGFQFDESMFHQSVTTLSGGQKTRLALAKLLLEAPDLLILDEPTNHLDIETLSWLESYLTHYQGALLIVSHDRYFLDRVVNQTYELAQNSLFTYNGGYTQFLKEKQKRMALQKKAYEQQMQEIKKIETFVQKNIARASTTKRAQSKQKQLEKMTPILPPQEFNKKMSLSFSLSQPSGNNVLMIEEATIGYPNKILSQNIHLSIYRQDKIALIGKNGVGKSTLLHTIMKQIPLIKGTITYGTNVSIGFYDQEQAQLTPQKTVLNELWDDFPNLTEQTIRTTLGRFLFSGDDVLKKVQMLSGGEKARLTLAKLSLTPHNFLILDEPTNHLDIESKELLEEALKAYEGTILFISHDRYFINQIANKVFELRTDGSELFLGNYDYYYEKKMEQLEINILKETHYKTNNTSSKDSHTQQSKNTYEQQKAEHKAQRAKQRSIEKIEEEILTLEASIEQCHHLMEELIEQQDFNELTKQQEYLASLEQSLEDAYQQWELLQE